MLGIFGVLDVMRECATYMESDINPDTGDYYTDDEIANYLGFPDDVNPFVYLDKKGKEAYDSWFQVNPKTGKYWTALEIAKEIGLIDNRSIK